MLTKEQKDKLNALKSELSNLKRAKLSKRIDADKIADLERQIRIITNPEIVDNSTWGGCWSVQNCLGCDLSKGGRCTCST